MTKRLIWSKYKFIHILLDFDDLSTFEQFAPGETEAEDLKPSFKEKSGWNHVFIRSLTPALITTSDSISM